MLFHPQLISNLKLKLEQDEALRVQWDSFTQKGEELLAQELLTEAYADSAEDQHGRYYELGSQMTDFGEVLGLLYAVTGERRYADKVKAAMAHYGAFARWTGPANPLRDPPWHSDLSTTRLLYGCATGLSLCGEAFTESEKQTAAEAMRRCGIFPLLQDWVLPETRVHALDSMGHNWWAVCIGFAGVGMLAAKDFLPEYDAWMPLVLEALRGYVAYPGALLHNKTANFDSEGLFYESLGYGNYGTGELLRFLFYYRQVEGKDAGVPLPPRAAEAMLTMRYPTSDGFLPVSFGDGSARQGIPVFALYALLYGLEPAAMLRTCYQKETYEMLDFLYNDSLFGKQEPVRLADEKIFPSGLAILRSSWAPDAALLAIRSGFTWNHAHEDAGSFQLFDKGQPLLVDSGNCGYHLPLYTSYYCRAEAHNAVLMDGQGHAGDPVHRGSKFPGSVTGYTAGGGMQYLLADATGPMCHMAERNYRHFLWIDHQILVIIDDIHTYQPVRLDWLLHTAGEVTVSNGLIIRNGEAVCSVQTVFPKDTALSERTGPKPYKAKETATYYAVTPKGKRAVEQFVTVIATGDAAGMKAEGFEAPDALGMRVADVTVYYNLRADGRRMHENSNNLLGGFETDAAVLALRGEDALMVWGSYLRKDGKVYHSSFEKEFCKVRI